MAICTTLSCRRLCVRRCIHSIQKAQKESDMQLEIIIHTPQYPSTPEIWT